MEIRNTANDSRITIGLILRVLCCCRCEAHGVVDVAHYDCDTLSVLLQERTEECTPVLAQLPLAAIEEAFVTLDQQHCMGALIEQQMCVT